LHKWFRHGHGQRGGLWGGEIAGGKRSLRGFRGELVDPKGWGKGRWDRGWLIFLKTSNLWVGNVHASGRGVVCSCG